MFNTFNKVLLGLVLIIIVTYFLQSRTNTPEACANIEGLWDASEQVCKTPTDKVIFQSLSKPNPVSIISPETQVAVVLNKAEQVDDIIYFRGQNSQLAEDGKETTEQGEVIYLNMSQFTLLDDNTKGLTYFAAPYIVNTKNNEINAYAGLFSYDFKTDQATHLNSAFLGNDIRETELTLIQKSVVKQNVFVQEGLIKFTFKSRGINQTTGDYPNQANEVLLQLVALDPNNNSKASFRSIMRMHPSWDVNHDGINDCEETQSCDPSFDYSQPKAN